ncbi:hypothetical protein H6F44_06515 [Pseudanabaena sp. FACHB-1277]|jgi:hypothetical protein|uniref:Uncharacterized protein n=1 Tax=Pseudanabaena cinerea FACHB-1277 TaxID=2949581 RepID=A0A926Z7E6_9CYAN|nr:hypothetical protein [Pseudanabaena cinerea]MBD2149779.1 hypothetical protein [Pseudanabaena cinerea FACHB-1277]
MTENKTKEIVERVSQQVGQTWTKVQPQLQALLLKLVKSLLPLLHKLHTQLTDAAKVSLPIAPIAQVTDAPEEEVTDATTTDATNVNAAKPITNDATATNKALGIVKGFSAQAIALLISALTKLQSALQTKEVAIDETSEPIGLLNAAPDSPMVAQVKQEFGIAWKFVQEQVKPKILAGLQFAVDKLDPIASNIWEKLSTKAAATPSLVKAWEDLQSKDAWKKTVTATAPIWRSMTGIAKQVPLSDEVQQIFDKRAGTIALVTLFSLLIILKPSPAHSRNLKKVATPPAPIAQPSGTVAQKPPTTAPAVTDELIQPEKGDVALTPEQIEIAKIQTQVTEVANQYGETLLGSVQTSFKRGRLIVALSDDWYQLAPNQQTQLVNDLQTRSRSLNFKKLLVADAANHLVARTPVTGEGVIILRQ